MRRRPKGCWPGQRRPLQGAPAGLGAAPRSAYLGVLVDDLVTRGFPNRIGCFQPRRIPAQPARGQPICA